MLDHLPGLVVRKEPTRVVVRAGGLGFDLRVSLHTSSRLAEGREALLYTHLHAVEGAVSLLGFASEAERELCRKLLGVSGVGPSTALAVLSTDSPSRVAAAIMRGEVRALTRVKGIGPRTAERICLELRDTVAALAAAGEEEGGPPREDAGEDAVAALVTLGFGEKEARRRVEAIRAGPGGGGLSAEEMIRKGLREGGAGG